MNELFENALEYIKLTLSSYTNFLKRSFTSIYGEDPVRDEIFELGCRMYSKKEEDNIRALVKERIKDGE